MIKWRYVVVSLAALVGVSAAAAAKDGLASLTEIDGSIFVKRDGRPIPVSGPFDLSRGDIILVTEESSARLVYANGCAVELGQSTVTEIDEMPQCDSQDKSGTQTTSNTQGTTETNIANDQGPSGENAATAGGDGLSDNTALVAGGSALLLGGAALLLLSGDGGGNDNGASP